MKALVVDAVSARTEDLREKVVKNLTSRGFDIKSIKVTNKDISFCLTLP